MLRPLIALLAFSPAALAQGFDPAHKAWDALLKKHVVVISQGKASQVDYAGLAKNRAALKAYLASLSAVSEKEFDAWAQPQRMAFLINAYNAFTAEKILTRYPRLQSIWDFGKLFGNPFKDEFFTLFDRKFSLDGIEHDRLRKPGAYDDPRVHFALNCASVGCPMLREEAYVGDRLDAQLEQQAERFLSDATRNRFANDRLEVSKIFDWFKDDWSRGVRGIQSREQYFARYSRLLAGDPAHRSLIAQGRAPLAFLEYDWTLNDLRK
ncbi:MAG: hypothetical protein A3I63_09075 [Betaproteobacteria bacterium RIFCSPLOWO2_02_FULL_66_14]|nr:MAG: hypothetical protein A3I63_09075 [Betaproteobacteria bacterium RIFCSPLOWO2_02_FULL_66_14]